MENWSASRSLSGLKNRSENLAGRGQILSILQVNSHSIDQKSGEIWTVQADLQPISFKPDRLLAICYILNSCLRNMNGGWQSFSLKNWVSRESEATGFENLRATCNLRLEPQQNRVVLTEKTDFFRLVYILVDIFSWSAP